MSAEAGAQAHRPRAAGEPREGPREARRRRTSGSCATGSAGCSTPARSSRTACSPTRSPTTCPPTAWSPASAEIDGRPVCVMANDPTVKAGSWGARTVEKIVRLTETALRARAAGRLPRRLRRRAHHRPGRAVPRPPRRGADLRQPGAALGPGAAGVLPVRAVGRGRRVHPRVLRRGVHGRGERVDVPRLAAHGRGGHQRGGDARGDGRRAHARHRQRLRRQPRAPTTTRRSTRRSAGCRTCRRSWQEPAAGRRARSPRADGASRSRRSCRSRSAAPTTCTR